MAQSLVVSQVLKPEAAWALAVRELEARVVWTPPAWKKYSKHPAAKAAFARQQDEISTEADFRKRRGHGFDRRRRQVRARSVAGIFEREGTYFFSVTIWCAHHNGAANICASLWFWKSRKFV
jgi:hypothetical protein